jgi:hypothetical protein
MMMMVSTMLRSLSTSSGNLQRPAVYASPLAFEWQPQAPTGQYPAPDSTKSPPYSGHSEPAVSYLRLD